jgi:hypothetical protein
MIQKFKDWVFEKWFNQKVADYVQQLNDTTPLLRNFQEAQAEQAAVVKTFFREHFLLQPKYRLTHFEMVFKEGIWYFRLPNETYQLNDTPIYIHMERHQLLLEEALEKAIKKHHNNLADEADAKTALATPKQVSNELLN